MARGNMAHNCPQRQVPRRPLPGTHSRTRPLPPVVGGGGGLQFNMIRLRKQSCIFESVLIRRLCATCELNKI